MPRRDPAEAAAARQAELDQLHARLTSATIALATEPGWQQWLTTAAKFHRYSLNNQLLILSQRPDATQCAGYRTWQAVGRQVNKGETGIRILAPVTRTMDDTDEHGRPRLDAHGQPRQVRKVVGFKPTSVFDISQTSGAPLATGTDPQLLTGQAPAGLWDGLAAQVDEAGYHLLPHDRTHTSPGKTNGLTIPLLQVVLINADLDDAHRTKTLAHELAHVNMHAARLLGLQGGIDCRGTMEMEAESVAYIVSGAAGLDTSSYSFGYVAGWATEALTNARSTDPEATLEQVIANTATGVLTHARQIIDKLDLPPRVEDLALDKALTNDAASAGPQRPQERSQTTSRPPAARRPRQPRTPARSR